MPLSSLQFDCLDIQHIAIFSTEKPLTSFLSKDKHRDFLDHLVKLSSLAEEDMDIMFPGGNSPVDSADLIKKGQNLYTKSKHSKKRDFTA